MIGILFKIGFEVKYEKFPYYNFWKLMRKTKEQVARGSGVKLSKMYNATANYFLHWLKEQTKEVQQQDIITLRKKFEEEVKWEENLNL